MNTYRKNYVEFYGAIPEQYEIHHIDHDKDNNNIFNLVAISKELRREYHNLKQAVSIPDHTEYRHLEKGCKLGTSALCYDLSTIRKLTRFLELKLRIQNIRDDVFYTKMTRG